jgi:hypothetical protein
MPSEGSPSIARYQARFFRDWSSGWLWADSGETHRVFGYAVDHHQLGLPSALSEELDRLSSWHDRSLNASNPDYPSPFRQQECDAFNQAVAAAFTQLCAQLGDSWDLVDETRELAEDPELDRYLSDPKTFRR